MSGSLSEVTGFVDDAFAVRVTAPFIPENIVLGVYTFLPWVRTGIAAAVQDPPAGQLRAGVTVTLPVQAPGVVDKVVSKSLSVRGPGDVLSIDERQVIRRYPQPDATNAEDSFLAHVEFARPDLPWLFSPQAPAGDRLRPWIALVVVRERLADITVGAAGLPPRLRTVLGELQPLDTDAWGWAHAQVVGPKANGGVASIEDRLSTQYGVANLSRLLCPRRLQPNETYLACVVPSYDCSVAAGLGQDRPGTLGPAWTRAADGSDGASEVELPCYDHWRFQTGPAGDFESLAEKLVPIGAPWSLGRRIIDASRPGGELPDLAAGDAGVLQVIRGPLFSPAPAPRGAPDEAATWAAAETQALRDELNLPDKLAGAPGALGAEQLPRIGPTIYAQHQAAVSRVDGSPDDDWLAQLNLRPTDRVVAGLGTRVVEKDREALMQSAWAQMGELEAVNAQLRRAQLARFAGASLHERHMQPLSYGDLLQMTRRSQARIRVDGAITVHAEIADSQVAPAAVTATFRRITRPQGPLARYAVGPARAQLSTLVASAGVARDFQRPYRDLDGVAAVSELGARALDPAVVARVLELGPVGPDAAARAVSELGATLATTTPFTDQLVGLAGKQIEIREGFDPARLGAHSALEALDRSAPNDPVRAVSYLNVLGGLHAAGGAVAERAGALAGRLGQRFHVEPPSLPVAPVRLAPRDPGAPALIIGPRAGTFTLESHGNRLLQSISVSQNISLAAGAGGIAAMAGELVSPDWPGTPALPALSVSGGAILAQLDPALTVTRRIKARLGTFPAWLRGDWFDDGLVRPIMAAPVFTRPMYQALDDYDRNWLIPGLGNIPQPDFVTLLKTNAEFEEAFLVGLSNEFGRKLLWRGFPTDLRGTSFRRFWDGTDELVADIHRFAPGKLGSHVVASLQDRLVLLVRGELIRRYPDAIVLAMRAHDFSKPPVFPDPIAEPSSAATILFHDHLDPDIVLVGFDLTAAQVTAEPWWFIIAEHPTAPRFGLREADVKPGQPTRDSVAWGDLALRLGFLDAAQGKAVAKAASDPASDPPTTQFGADAASNARVLLRDPVRAAFAGKDMIAPILGAP